MEYTTVKASSKLTIIPPIRRNNTCLNIRKAGICLSKSYYGGQNVDIHYTYNVIRTHLKNTCESEWVNLGRAANCHKNVCPVRNLRSPYAPGCSIKVFNLKAFTNGAAIAYIKIVAKLDPHHWKQEILPSMPGRRHMPVNHRRRCLKKSERFIGDCSRAMLGIHPNR
jgi:hypothetical protein